MVETTDVHLKTGYGSLTPSYIICSLVLPISGFLPYLEIPGLELKFVSCHKYLGVFLELVCEMTQV